ncbi:MAG: hypothetical protein K2X08_03855 [Chlamydiales bacterium]|nr:hypothetical protein [Chlamydiales bacterium]
MTQDLLDIYTNFLIAQSQYATVTSLSNLLEGSISHDDLCDFSTKMHLQAKTLAICKAKSSATKIRERRGAETFEQS